MWLVMPQGEEGHKEMLLWYGTLVLLCDDITEFTIFFLSLYLFQHLE